jgi:hypothetical protein
MYFQIILAYASIRAAAAGKNRKVEDSSIHESSVGSNELISKSLIGLPPSPMILTLCFFFILPILADLHNQVKLSVISRETVKKISTHHEENAPEFIAVSSVKILNSPAFGGPPSVVLPKGAIAQKSNVKTGELPGNF